VGNGVGVGEGWVGTGVCVIGCTGAGLAQTGAIGENALNPPLSMVGAPLV
jgi:hypothetical protein